MHKGQEGVCLVSTGCSGMLCVSVGYVVAKQAHNMKLVRQVGGAYRSRVLWRRTVCVLNGGEWLGLLCVLWLCCD